MKIRSIKIFRLAILLIAFAVPASAMSSDPSSKPLTLTNYVSGESVNIKNPLELTPVEGAKFIPQQDEFIDMYLSFIQDGVAPINAIVEVHFSDELLLYLSRLANDTELEARILSGQ